MTNTAAVEAAAKEGSKLEDPVGAEDPSDPGRPASSRKKSESRRISVSLTGRACDLTRQLGKQLDMTEGEVVRKAIGLLATAAHEEQQGSTLVLRSPDGDYLKVLWNTPMFL